MRESILGFPVDSLTKEEALQRIESFLDSESQHFSVAINPEKLMKAVNDAELSLIIKSSDLNFVDGVGVAWALRIFRHKRIKQRITGIDLMGEVLKIAETKKLSVYFLGAEQPSIEKAVYNIGKLYPSLVIKGYHNGFFSDDEAVVNEIRLKAPDVIFVGMGSPKQEKFIFNNLKELGAKFSMGVGGSFNVYAGEFRRAPKIIQALGLEWLYRFVLDPKRLPRIMKLPKFLLLVAKYRENKTVKEEVNFLGIRVSNRNIESTLEVAQGFVEKKGFHIVVTLNGEMASKALNDRDFLKILRESDLVIPDGIGVIWGARRFGERINYRVPGIEFAWELLKRAEKKGYSVFFLGAHTEVLEKAVAKIKMSFPNLNVVGMHHGYLKDCEDDVIKAIQDLSPDILFVGMGGIKQEKWIMEHKSLNVPLNIGIGGSYDVWAGKVKRAPYLIRKLGLEWLYRTVTQPARIRRTCNLFIYSVRILFGKVND
ncbi:MAG: WecB/TagA/CpsF family glycosyltransferase [Caldisericaceae bacterium]